MSAPKPTLGTVPWLGTVLLLTIVQLGLLPTRVEAQVAGSEAMAAPTAPLGETAAPPLETPAPQPDSLDQPSTETPITVTTEAVPSPAPEAPLPPEPEAPLTETEAHVEGASETAQSLELLPVGLKVGDRLQVQSTLVMGLENGTEAVNFEAWLVPWGDLTQALQIQSTVLEDGQWEVRSPGFIIRLDPDEFTEDPELGQALSIADIRHLFNIPVEFDIADYAIRLDPPWSDRQRQSQQAEDLPVITEGLPLANSEEFVFTTLGQRVEASGTNGDNTYQGQLTSVGSLWGGSWFVRLNQTDLFSSSTWNFSEAQYLRQSDPADYVVGSQPTFWQSQGGGEFWGFTTIQRFGYEPIFNASGGGFNPNQRLQADGVGRTVSGEAPPNTLVQLTQGFRDNVIAEVLVDSSGVYRFEDVPGNGRYEVLLYPNGQLTVEPEARSATFSSLPSRLAAGDSAFVASAGLGRTLSTGSNLLGNFEDFRGGVAYRYGASDELTVGIGTIYDGTVLGLGELFYDSTELPIRFSASILGGVDDLDIEAALTYQPSTDFRLDLNTDSLSSQFRATWQAFPGLRLNVGGNTRENVINVGTAFSYSNTGFNINGNLEYTTQNNFRWSLLSRFNQAEFRSVGNELSTNHEFTYKLSAGRDLTQGHFLLLGYETQSAGGGNHLTTVRWRYRSADRARDGRYLWEMDLGYGLGSQGQGVTAAVSTAVLPGLILRARYEGVSALTGDDTYRIELVPFVNTQGRFLPQDSRYNDMRQQGGLWVQPFVDSNGNGSRDLDERLYLENATLLLRLNNDPLRDNQLEIHKKGIFIRLDPGIHRVDLDPAGYPVDQQPLQTAYAVDVVSGSYTSLLIPLMPSYTVAGQVLDSNGEPLGGVRVEAIANDAERRSVSVTNGAGIFYLENLGPGSYQVLTNGQPAQPTASITLTEHSDPIVEITLQMLD